MKTAYFDCLGGASGDMILASLIDAGLDVSALYDKLRSLPIGKFNLSTHKTKRGSLSALRFEVQFSGGREHERRLADILEIIDESPLDSATRDMCTDIFRRLAEAEAAVHGTTPDEVHFHEIGALDSIVDIIGAVVGLEELGIDQVLFSGLALGSGSVQCSHGTLPVPAPATLELVRGFRAAPTDTEGEMLTPTGAAILTTVGVQKPPPGDFLLETIGYGAGTTEREGRPNVLRVLIGSTSVSGGSGDVVVLETNIDDMSPELFPPVFEKVLEAGALDVYITPALMKKGRPGHLLTVIVDEDRRSRIEDIIFTHTSTFGLRRTAVTRSCLDRIEDVVDTKFGPIRVKKGFRDGRLIRTSPEYEDCRKAAEEADVSVGEVWNEALARA